MNGMFFLDEADELRKFPMTDKQFNDVYSGDIWTPRELSDWDIENTIEHINYQIAHRTENKRSARIHLRALIAEKMRREIRLKGGLDPAIGKSEAMEQARKKVMEKIAKESKEEDIIIEVRTTSGAIWERTILKPCRFSTGSTGYRVTERVKNPADFTKFQFSASLVKVGSKPKAEV